MAWRSAANPNHYVKEGKATLADDPSRGSASCLVQAIALVENDGPDDVAPGEHRLSREVICVRLDDQSGLARDAERIRFSLDEPMSRASPDEATIETLGYTPLPITWRE